MYVCSVIQSCPTLCNPIDCNPPDSPVHGIFQARILKWVVIASSRGIVPIQGSNLHLLYILHWLVTVSLLLSHLGSPRTVPVQSLNFALYFRIIGCSLLLNNILYL